MVFATATHAIVGALVGFGAAGLIYLFSFGGSRLIGVPAYLLASAVGIWLVADSTAESCRRHPLAPMGVALGIGLGAAVFAFIGLTFGGPAPMAFGVLLATAMGVASHSMGRRALRRSLGAVRQGVGLTCATCAYDLRGTPDGWPCPECGGLMRFELAPE